MRGMLSVTTAPFKRTGSLNTGIQEPQEINDNPEALAGRCKIAKFLCSKRPSIQKFMH